MFSQLSPKDLSAPKLHLHPFKREKGGNHKNLPKNGKRRETPNFACEVGGGGFGRKRFEKEKTQ